MAGVIERTESPSTWVAVNVGIDFEVNAFRAVEQKRNFIERQSETPILYSGGG
jgi:hypothetical protein